MRLRAPVFALPLALLVAAACSKDSSSSPEGKTYPPDAIDGVAETSKLTVAGLQEGVRIIRDKRGMVHIYARNLHDAALAEGYVAALDRAPQLEIFRRLSEGRLAEYAGNLQASLAAQDIYFRAIGLRRTAEKYYASLAPTSEAKLVLDAYAAGVTARFQEIRAGASVPNGWLAIPRKKYLDWDAAASLAIARLQTWSLSWNGDQELDDTALFDAARTTFRADATDPDLKARAGFSIDVLRFEPPVKVPVLAAPPTPTWLPKPGGAGQSAPAFASPPHLSSDLLARVRPVLDAGRGAAELFGRRGSMGSNNWVISPAKSTTGHALVASDPHLALKAPAIFHMVSLHVVGDPAHALDVAGMAFAGIPGVVLGFNKDIAWGATVSEFDVQDLYRDVIGKDGKVTVGGAKVDVVPITEMMDYGDGRPQPIVIETIPGHGVVLPNVQDNRFVPRTSGEVISYRWTGMEPSGELEAFLGLVHAKSVDEAIAAMQPFQVGSQNFVFGDSAGNIGYTTHSWVPIRPKAALAWDAKTHTGQLPCFVLAGDAGLEWTGKLTDAQLPTAKNPAVGYLSTANSDQFGNAFDDDPSNDASYLSCQWDPGFREARIHERIDAILASPAGKVSPDDVASIQADAKSPLGTRIAKHLAAAIGRAEDARSGKTPAADLAAVLADARYRPARMQLVQSMLTKWADAGYDTPAAIDVAGDPAATPQQIAASQATLVFNASLVPLFKYVFDDEWKAMGSPRWSKDYSMKALLRFLEKATPLATADASGESVVWDDLTTKGLVESKDDRLVRGVLDGLAYVEKTQGADESKWRWGAVHTVRFATLLSGTEGQLSIPTEGDARFPAGGFPRHGDEHVVDASHYGLGGSDYTFSFDYADGPAQRFVADMAAPAPVVRNVLPGGNQWIPGSAHFDDEAQKWRLNQNAPVAWSPGDVVVDAEERIDLMPAAN